MNLFEMNYLQHAQDIDSVLKHIHQCHINNKPIQLYEILKSEGLTLADLDSNDMNRIEKAIARIQ